MDRREYASRYGPTTGDRVRLADTSLEVTVEDDHVGYGDEALFGFGKTLRSRLLQDDRATRDSELDVVVLGVLLVDPVVGIVKTHLGVKDGRVVGIGRIDGPRRTARTSSWGRTPTPSPATGSSPLRAVWTATSTCRLRGWCRRHWPPG
jgi:urease subunit alpha